MLLCAICERLPLLLEIYSPTDSTDTHRFYIFQYPCSSMLSVGDSFCCLRFILPQIPQISQILYIPVSVFICAICGKLLRPRYPCSSPISVGAILCILRLFSHRFHGFSQMHLEILSHPISVLICDICGSHPLLLEIYSPTDSTDFHRFYIFQYPCSSVLSVGDSFARRWKLLFLHRQRDAASALIHFRHSHHHVLVQLHHVVRVLHVAVSQL